MAKKKRRAVKKQPPEPTLAERIEKLRDHVHMVTGIVSCARYASDSMICDGEPDLVDGLKAALELLGDIDEQLELMEK